MSQPRYRPRRSGAYAYRSASLPYGGSRKAGRLKRSNPMGHAVTGSVGKNEYHGDHRDQYVLSIGALTLNPYSLADIHFKDANGTNQAKLASNVWYHVGAALLRRVLRMVLKRDIQYPLEKIMYDLPASTAFNTAANVAAGLTTGGDTHMEHHGTHGLTSMNACRLRLYWADPTGVVNSTVGLRYDDIPFMYEAASTGINIGDKKSFGQVAIDLAECFFDNMDEDVSATNLAGYRYPYAVEVFGIDATATTTATVVNNYVERAICAPIIIKDWVFKVNTSGFMRIQNQTAADDGSKSADVINGNPLVCVRQVFSGMPRIKPLIGSNPQAPIQDFDGSIAGLRNPQIFQQDVKTDCILKHLNNLRKIPPRYTWTNCIGEERFILNPGQVYTMPLRCSFTGKLVTLMHRLRDYNRPPAERDFRSYPLGHANIVFASHYMAAQYPAGYADGDDTAPTVPVLISVQYHAEFKCGASCRPRYRRHIMVVDAAGIYQKPPDANATTGLPVAATTDAEVDEMTLN